MENVFKTFNQDFWKSEKSIIWYDKEGIMTLDEERVVTFSIEDRVMRNNYEGYSVKIYNKNKGEIVSKFFSFSNHLEMIQRDEKNSYSHVWLNGGKFGWYIDKPKNTKEMVSVVMDWISKFK